MSADPRSSLVPFLIHAYLQHPTTDGGGRRRPSVAIQHGSCKDGTVAHAGWALRCYLPNGTVGSVAEALTDLALLQGTLRLEQLSRRQLKGHYLAPMVTEFVDVTNMLNYWCWIVDLGNDRKVVTLAHPDRFPGGLSCLEALKKDGAFSIPALVKGFSLSLLHSHNDESQVWWLHFPWSVPENQEAELKAAKVVTLTAGLSRGLKDVDPVGLSQKVAAAGHMGLGAIAQAMLSEEAQNILTASEESLLGYRLLACAHTIHKKEEVSVVLLSGPSASGKTSIANRLALSLRSLGNTPVIVTLDDYYRSPQEPTYPKMPDGITLNHELVECLRIERFQKDMQSIIDLQPGNQVQLPRFDFVAQESLEEGPVISRGTSKTMGRNIVIVEGIFSLDPKLTCKIPVRNKFGVFTSPTGLSVDEFHRLAADDLRLLRRIYRDYLHRGRSASLSIERTAGVAAGAVTSIFPTMSQADYFVDGGMAHEAWLLKDKTMAILHAVPPAESEEPEGDTITDGGAIWNEACRLRDQVLSRPVGTAASSLLPSWSILEEFLGTPYVAELPEQSTDLVKATTDAVVGAPCDITELVDGLSMLIQYRLLPEMNCAPEDLLGYLCHGRLCSPFEEVPSGPQQVFAKNYEKNINILTGTGINNSSDAEGADALLEHQEVWSEQIRQETAKFVLGAAARLLVVRGKMSKERGVFTVLHNYLASGTKAVNACFAHWTSAIDGQYTTSGSVTEEELKLLQEAVDEVLEANSPIGITSLSTEEALALLTETGKPFSAALVASLQQPLVQIAYSELPPDPTVEGVPPVHLATSLYTAGPLAGCQKQAAPFNLSLVDGGLRISFHETKAPTSAVPLDMSSLENEAAASAYTAHRAAVGSAMAIHTTASLNFALTAGFGQHPPGPKVGQHLLHLGKALEMTHCFSLAHDIRSNKVKAVAVAGGSASGKSVFVTQLSYALTSLGIHVTTLSLDNYYMDADSPTYPVVPGTDGQKNYETVDALRLAYLNGQLEVLLYGQQQVVETPIFDLGKGQCTQKTVDKVLPGEGSVLIIEGLFALSEKIMPFCPAHERRKVMLLPLPFVQLDELHPTNTEHLRILRRIYRDATERGRTATTTLGRAAAVGHGELENTLPFIRDADVVVSTTSMTEFHQLASDCLRLLRSVHLGAGDSIHAHSAMIRSYLEWFQPMDG